MKYLSKSFWNVFTFTSCFFFWSCRWTFVFLGTARPQINKPTHVKTNQKPKQSNQRLSLCSPVLCSSRQCSRAMSSCCCCYILWSGWETWDALLIALPLLERSLMSPRSLHGLPLKKQWGSDEWPGCADCIPKPLQKSYVEIREMGACTHQHKMFHAILTTFFNTLFLFYTELNSRYNFILGLKMTATLGLILIQEGKEEWGSKKNRCEYESLCACARERGRCWRKISDRHSAKAALKLEKHRRWGETAVCTEAWHPQDENTGR